MLHQSEINQDRPAPRAPLNGRVADYVLTIRDTAALLSVCTKTIVRMLADGRLRGIRISERRRGILASEVARFLNQSSP